MKLSNASMLAIVATLATTTISASLLANSSTNAATQTIATSSAKLPAQANLLAQTEATPLATQLQGKPIVVDIYASWCGGCKNIAPTLSQIRKQYGSKISFVVFDVTDSQKTQASMKMAAKLGLTGFFNANKSETSTVAIIDPATGKITKQFQNNANLSEYTSILDRSIAQMGGGMMKKPDAMSNGDAMKKTDAMGNGDAMKK